MSATTITVAIILVILASIGALAFSQARERARIARVRKINAYQDSYRRMQKLLTELPPQYLDNELRLVVLHRAEEILKDLKPFNVDPEIDAKLTSIQETIKQIHEGKFKLPPRPITTELQGKEARQLMETLIKFIDTQRAKKRIDSATAKKYIKHTTYLICQSKADLFKEKALASEKAGKPRRAIHHYHNAIDQLKKVQDNPLAIKSIKSYRLKMKALEELAEEKNKELKAQSAKKIEESEEWNKFINEDDGWKKKSAYDD